MQAEILISPKHRIKSILESKSVDRLGIFDIDIRLFSGTDEKKREEFFLFTFNGPFQSISSGLGLEDALIAFEQEPRHTLSSFKDCQKRAFAEYRKLKDDGYRFDGVWMWEDIAYDKGLYFSPEKYRNQLFRIHRDICDFFNAEGLPLFFHCDGGLEDLIPLLVEARVAAIHPVQELCNPNLIKLKRDFTGALTFIGGVGLHRLRKDREGLFEYINMLKEGQNYIFCFDAPLPDGLEEEYNRIIKDIESIGIYR